MSPYKDDLSDRLDAAAKARQAMLEKFRARQRPVQARDTADTAATVDESAREKDGVPAKDGKDSSATGKPLK